MTLPRGNPSTSELGLNKIVTRTLIPAYIHLALRSYVRFVAARSTGEAPTGASWQRSFVTSHPAYARDSVVSAPIAYDLLREAASLGLGERVAPLLLGEEAARFVRSKSAAPLPAAGGNMSPPLGRGVAGASSVPLSTSSTAAPRVPAAAGVRLRGKSFAEEVQERASSSKLVKALVDR